MGEILSTKDKRTPISEVTREHILRWNKDASECELNILNCDFNYTIKILTQLLLERWVDEEK